ncbi:hypothetical protein COT48_01510, partial [Candidatus Woesearchaeota archaeon CG08_land_8_20_14_0_20_47_9]
VIIFDLDGTLVNSQPLQYKAYNQVFSKHGYSMTRADWDEWIHQGHSAHSWVEKHNLLIDAEMVRADKKRLYDELIKDELELMPGAAFLTEQLVGKYRLCVASSSRIESVNACLQKFDLHTRFEMVISDAEEVRGKPYPDIFLRAAELMNVRPEECLVIEDSIAGLKAAKAAGMRCIICPDSFSNIPLPEFNEADHLVTNLRDVLELGLV